MKKRRFMMIAALLLGTALTLAGCGSSSSEKKDSSQKKTETEAKEDRGDQDEKDAENGKPEADNAGRKEDSGKADDEPIAEEGAASLSESDSRLLSFHHTSDGTYFMAAVQRPRYFGEKAQKQMENYGTVYHNTGSSVYARDEALSYAYHYLEGEWVVVYVNASDPSLELGDFRIHMYDYEDETYDDFTFSERDLAAEDEYADFGLCRMGSRYVHIVCSLHNNTFSGSAYSCYAELRILDVAVKDHDNLLTEEDIPLDAFTLYTGDGVPAEEFFGTECEREMIDVSIRERGGATVGTACLGFYPADTSGDKETQRARIRQEMIDPLLETDPYVTYTDPDGNVYTYTLAADDIG